MQLFKKIVVTVMMWESRIIISKYKPFIVAVTGSVGKTSTKDAVYSVLKNSSKYARKSEKSMNSEIGLPLTIIGVPNAWKSLSGWMRNIFKGLEIIIWRADYPDCLILEIGADHPGDIEKVTKWLHPDIVVMTKVSQTPVHVEFFTSPEDVFKEKAFLAKAVKVGGTLVLLADDEKIMGLAIPSVGENAKNIGGEHIQRVVSYGITEKSDIRGSDVVFDYSSNSAGQYLIGTSFNLSVGGNVTKININGVLGNAYMYPLLAATAVGQAKGMLSGDIIEGLNEYKAPLGRMNIIPGINDSTIIDDTYNSSPDAVLSALDALVRVETSGRKIVVLGDMMELGKYASDEHRRVGSRVSEVASLLVTVGPRSKLATVEGALSGGMSANKIHDFDSSDEAGRYVSSVVAVGDVVLVKGSQSMRMERVSVVLLRDPARAGELRVRQEAEWLEKK